MRRWEEPTTAAQTGSSTQTVSAASPQQHQRRRVRRARRSPRPHPRRSPMARPRARIRHGDGGVDRRQPQLRLATGRCHSDRRLRLRRDRQGHATRQRRRRHLADGQQRRLLAGVQRSCQWLYGRAAQPARAWSSRTPTASPGSPRSSAVSTRAAHAISIGPCHDTGPSFCAAPSSRSHRRRRIRRQNLEGRCVVMARGDTPRPQGRPSGMLTG